MTQYFAGNFCPFIYRYHMMSGLSLLQTSRVRIRRVPKDRGMYAWPSPFRSQTQIVNGVCDPPASPTSLATLVMRMRLADLSTSQTEEFTNCRIDHYQTPANVHVSVFAKQVDKARSTVVFESEKVPLPRKCTRQVDDICAAGLIDISTDPYRFISARWQTVQTFP